MMTTSGSGTSRTRYFCPTGPEYSKIHQDREMSFLGLKHLPFLLGITGPSKAGKTMIAKFLVTEHGFHYEVLSSFLREKAKYLGMKSPTWQDLGEIAVRWRREEGCAILFDLLFRKMSRDGTLRDQPAIVIDGILHPDEAKAVLAKPNSALIAVVAGRKQRYDSSKGWFSADKVPSWEDFVMRDQWEFGLDKARENHLQAPDIGACIRLTPPQNRFVYKGHKRDLFSIVEAYIQSLHIHQTQH